MDYNPDAVGAVAAWFDELWGEADDFKDQLVELLFPRLEEYDPQSVSSRLGTGWPKNNGAFIRNCCNK